MICTAKISLNENDWRDALSAGDVVVYLWPLIDPAPGEVPKLRPSLVLAIREIDGVRHAELVFGTGQLRRRNPRDVILDDPGAMRCAGVRKPTRFEFGRRLTVRLDDPGFAVSAALNTAVLGRMPIPVAHPRGFHLCRRRSRDRAGTPVAAAHPTRA
jgi:hypothetical protein